MFSLLLLRSYTFRSFLRLYRVSSRRIPNGSPGLDWQSLQNLNIVSGKYIKISASTYLQVPVSQLRLPYAHHLKGHAPVVFCDAMLDSIRILHFCGIFGHCLLVLVPGGLRLDPGRQ